MKILQVLAGIGGANGAAVVACGFSRELARRGHDVTVATLAEEGQECCLDGVRAVRCRGDFPAFVRYSRELSQNLRTLSAWADVVCVHGSWTYPVWRGCAAAAEAGKPAVVAPHGSFDPVRLRYSAWKKRLAAPIDRRCLRGAACVLAMSPIEEGWVRAFEPAVRRVEVLPPGIEAVPPLAPRAEDGVLHVLYMGRRHPLKGVDVLEEAAKGMEGVDVRIESAVFGEAKRAALAWCDVLALPSWSENFGLVVAEAMASGRPVIVTDGTPWEEVEKRGCGWFARGFGKGDRALAVANLRAALVSARDMSGQERHAMGERGRQWTEGEFSWERAGERMEALLAEIAGGKR